MNKILPDFVLIILLASSLFLTAKHTLTKGLKTWEKESLAMQSADATTATATSVAKDDKGHFARVEMTEDDEDWDGEKGASDGVEMHGGVASLKSEDEADQVPRVAGVADDEGGEFNSSAPLSGDMSSALAEIEEEERHHPVGKVLWLCTCFFGTMLLKRWYLLR